MDLTDIADDLTEQLAPIRPAAPITHAYNPLVYARAPYEQYVTRYGRRRRDIVLFGMNPGPWGMVQTGVPFGEVAIVRDWLHIAGRVGRPPREHPKRPVFGFACTRSEVSGRRIWGWARDRFGTPPRFFRRFFIANYCPLAFFDRPGRNVTPDKLPPKYKQAVLTACDAAMRRTVEHLRPRYVIGVGAFVESRAAKVLADLDLTVARILHPSPASPAANNDWAGKVSRQLADIGIELP